MKQRLGSLAFKEDTNADPSLFDWAGTQAMANLEARKEILDLKSRYDAQAATLKKLNAQLDNFIVIKKRNEDEMLEQFRQLLNTKKLKIRGK